MTPVPTTQAQPVQAARPALEREKGESTLQGINPKPVPKPTEQSSMRSTLSPLMQKNFETLKKSMEIVSHQEYVIESSSLVNKGRAKFELSSTKEFPDTVKENALSRYQSATGNPLAEAPDKNTNPNDINLYDKFLSEAKETFLLEQFGKQTLTNEKIDKSISDILEEGVALENVHKYVKNYYKDEPKPACSKGEQPGVEAMDNTIKAISQLCQSEAGKKELEDQYYTLIQQVITNKELTLSSTDPRDPNLEMNPEQNFSEFSEGGFNHLKAHKAMMDTVEKARQAIIDNVENVKQPTHLQKFLILLTEALNTELKGLINNLDAATQADILNSFAFMANRGDLGVPQFDKDGNLDIDGTIIDGFDGRGKEDRSMGPFHLFLAAIGPDPTSINLLAARLKAGSEGPEALQALEEKLEYIKEAAINVVKKQIIEQAAEQGITLEISHYGDHGNQNSLDSTHIHLVIKVTAITPQALSRLNEGREAENLFTDTNIKEAFASVNLNNQKTPLYVTPQKTDAPPSHSLQRS
jgi:hypothetical protein